MLTLYYHPFSSFCQKALIALYEAGAAFEGRVIDLQDPQSREELERVWPLAKFPVLTDSSNGRIVPESSLIIKYLALREAGAAGLLPPDPDDDMRADLLDRIFDNYVNVPLGKVVVDRFRPEDRRDEDGVSQARALIGKAYELIEDRLSEDGWAVGDRFTIADCSAAPSLFYSNIIVPIAPFPRLAAYYRRLLSRPSFQRAIDGGRPYRHYFPFEWPADY